MKRVYFIGIGGIGMSAIARYFHAKGFEVCGYDLTPSPITDQLIKEGIGVHFSDDLNLIPTAFFSPADSLIVYTPAVPADHAELTYFRSNGYRVMKRAEILGEITLMERALCVAGTHGKTTTSTLLAHLLRYSHVDCNAFLGGISNNYQSNLLLSDKSDLVVVEADEFDRSFHHLKPFMAIITSADPDHLDIYGTAENYRDSFEHFTSLIQSGGVLLLKYGAPVNPRLGSDVRLFTYSSDDRQADYYASDITIRDGRLFFTWYYPGGRLREIELGVPIRINVENAVAAMAIAHLNGVTLEELRSGIASFKGSHRRFEKVLDTDRVVLIDDYAHHPVELDAAIRSVRELYSDRRIMGIFQPHLYSRTADFYQDFAKSLSMLDKVVLLDIYPARELPMPGVTSRLILDLIDNPNKTLVSKNELLDYLHNDEIPDVVLILGAGDIDRLVIPVKQYLQILC
ncbi:UDP-N-acetylmuramate--alanine ligase [Porphyromonas sp. COT-052 OH4946]|uniref:UDP-N-acetylmuramate--L-alanine ligase n=1 Tax=Porphyromonas sp. COT-052 OH4946 TaxID=1515618 RepID=UPI00051D0A28|nr:UDP-N-acetylmuramate--L-alanine ligase [Porphyromonas sp. COT-052 OH4946]KGL55055.1 UDP-N-acetylmuramate--alanine ligase [Porphyromonas sp. COT-052 OH4946]